MKDYKKILKGVVNIISTAEKSDIGFAEICTYLGENCPELKESEDEKIRKAIKQHILFLDDSFPDKENWLAWLEKQGEPVEINPTEFDTRLQNLIGQFESLPKEELIGSLSFWLNVVQNDGTYKPDEKQGEPTIKKGKKYRCTKTHTYAGVDWIWGIDYYASDDYSLVNKGCSCYCPKYDKGNHNNLFEEVEYDECVEKQGEQNPTDKVEPKFKVGDWIISHYNHVAYVKSIDENNYSLSCNDGNSERLSIDCTNRNWRLWTLQDAKEGDVLVNWNNTVFIFKDIADETVRFHIAYNEKWDYAVKTPSEHSSHLGLTEPQFEFHPATKEQRDLLFQKMTESGYKWDTEKKELKKIRIEDLVQSVEVQKPAEWSEEDEKMLHSIIIDFSRFRHNNISTLEPHFNECIKWLKSLRPQNRWKPTKEQLIELRCAISGCSVETPILLQLEEDLKKLL